MTIILTNLEKKGKFNAIFNIDVRKDVLEIKFDIGLSQIRAYLDENEIYALNEAIKDFFKGDEL